MKTTNVKKSNKGLKILLAILCILIIGIGAVCYNQRENIDALVTSVKYSKEDIQQKIDNSKENVQGTLNEYDIGNLRDFTFEEEEQIRRGEITYEEALNKIMEESNLSDIVSVEADDSSNNSQSENTVSSDKNSSAVIPNVKANTNDPKAIVAEYTIKLTALKAQFLGQLGGLIDQAKAEYKQTKDVKSLAANYISRASSMEDEADASVDSLLGELRSKLEAVGADTSVADKMKSAYEEEKTLKKSYYLSLYEKKG